MGHLRLPSSIMSRGATGAGPGPLVDAAMDVNCSQPGASQSVHGMCFDQFHLCAKEFKVLGRLSTIDIFRVFHDGCRGLLATRRLDPSLDEHELDDRGGKAAPNTRLVPLAATAADAAAAEKASLGWLLGGGSRPRHLSMTLDQFRDAVRALLRAAFESGQSLFGAPEADAYTAPLALDSGVSPASVALRCVLGVLQREGSLPSLQRIPSISSPSLPPP